MKTALLLNGAKIFGSSGARLSATLQECAKNELIKMGYEVIETIIDEGYKIEDEVKKLSSANLIIYQMPAWWMGEPWIVKKYIDEVFNSASGILYKNDGRSHTNPAKNYGRGGLSQDKKVMFSVTWNAPLEAFIDKNEFFEGRGVEMVYFHLQKAHEFLGMKVLPIFMCNDVIKNPQIELYLSQYRAHLAKVL